MHCHTSRLRSASGRKPQHLFIIAISRHNAWVLLSQLSAVDLYADIATVIEGQQYLPGSRQLPYGGQDVTAMLGDMLAKRGARVPDEGGLTRLKELAARLRGGGEEDEVLLS